MFGRQDVGAHKHGIRQSAVADPLCEGGGSEGGAGILPIKQGQDRARGKRVKGRLGNRDPGAADAGRPAREPGRLGRRQIGILHHASRLPCQE